MRAKEARPLIRLALTDLGLDYGCNEERGHLTFNPLNRLLLHGLPGKITLDISLTDTSRFAPAGHNRWRLANSLARTGVVAHTLTASGLL